MPILADYHMHTPRCKHALGPMEGYVEKAIALKLREIGFSDHNPLPNGWGPTVRMDEWELDDYVADVLRLRERYRGAIEVKLGLEADYVEGLEDYIAKQRNRHPWDYIIGSVHYLDAECKKMSWPRNYAGDMSAIWTRYYELIRKLAATGSYDIVAHFDLPKRTGRPATEREDEAVALTLRELARTGMSMEINTSGYRHKELAVLEPYPNLHIVKQAVALNIPLTVNSDSHAPEQVGTEFPAVTEMLRSIGYRELASYTRRKRQMYPL